MAPTTQKALYLAEKFGEYIVGDVPVPKPGKGEVLLKIIATSLNPVDWFIKKYGLFIEKFPAILGLDLAGVVEDVGEGVSEWTRGDKV
jgi:NADPH:quinone reductase-like Zn-dependent oxidoreductase